ncbi:helicase C-terminal domain-containing protein [Tengunoibacter tsumagoiensis]|uniref:Uncharacterized protein n=1 Tax=Tengunoibacter tsumagoiensis TaxID=2014871 RepID=A0A401ZXA9_9CHLR|nr:helicase C-terminal domain-containing protein [Tengunoibacter tsumagoiensis]GCE11481.1 hypothetical protein KTT_13400 [Tengunoibacter tsumagoiensis]
MPDVGQQQIGQYLVTDLLRASSTSTFFIGTQRKKKIILKKLSLPLPTNESKEAFLARAHQLKKLKDRMIVNILDANFISDFAYLVMDYVDWRSLGEQFPAGEQLAPDQVKQILSPIAGALHYAHARNIFHGNLHPGNLLVGERNTTLLAEFALTPPGFSPVLDEVDLALPYMAPEQLEGEVSAASDQYALAVMVYEWLCGRRPYSASERAGLLQAQLGQKITPPTSLNPAVSPAVEKVLLQALALEPEQRFPHIQAFSDHYLSALMGFAFKTPQPAARPAKRVLPKVSEAPETPEAPAEPEPLNTAPPRLVIPDRGEKATIPSLKALPNTPRLSTLVHESEANYVEQTPIPDEPVEKVKEPRKRRTLLEDDDDDRLFPESMRDGFGESRLLSKVVSDLRQGGVLSESLPGYEERPAQVEMASLISRAITESTPAIIEAGTGTGKSLAYLVPIVRSGEVAIVSTANKALQEQLFYKDIPFVQRYIKPFEAALVKGVNNYVCLDRVESERTGMQFFTKNRDFNRLLEMTLDPDSKFNGDFETLGFQLPNDIRSRVATDSDQCAWNKCAYFEDCYVHKMRERAERAQVIVVNHTLLLLDAALGGFLLPERDLIVLDEAHHLEEEATRSFTISVAPAQIQTLLAQRMLKDHTLLHLQDETMRTAMLMWSRLEQITNFGFKGRANLEAPMEEGLRLATVISDLADSLRKQRPKTLDEKEAPLYDKLLKRTQNLAENIRTIFSVSAPDKFVYYIERIEGSASKGFVLQASAAPLDVTSWLKEKLFDKCNVISTSATLATIGPNPVKPHEKGPNFAYFRKRIGLDPQERPDVLEHILPLAFDYEQNSLLYLPRHLPPPTFGEGADDYMLDIAREMYKLVKISRGRAFLLFSSKRMMDRAYELMSPHLPYPLLKQGDMTRLELTKRFRQEEGAVLFGLKSFWEGVDIAGDALSLVVIDKLPFDPPDDPVHEARVAQMKAAGENWFGTYVLPQAVLRLKQGIGRLLRTREDRGVMAILDTRLHTKGYGRQVLDAMPPARRTSNIRDVDRFFAEDRPAF